jgi:hypothetical protein
MEYDGVLSTLEFDSVPPSFHDINGCLPWLVNQSY